MLVPSVPFLQEDFVLARETHGRGSQANEAALSGSSAVARCGDYRAYLAVICLRRECVLVDQEVNECALGRVSKAQQDSQQSQARTTLIKSPAAARLLVAWLKQVQLYDDEVSAERSPAPLPVQQPCASRTTYRRDFVVLTLQARVARPSS